MAYQQRAYREHKRTDGRSPYIPPSPQHAIAMRDLLEFIGRDALEDRQYTMLNIDASATTDRGPRINYAGDLAVLKGPSIAVIGARDASEGGKRRAYQLGKQLAERGVTVVSGLAAGIDRAALEGAIDVGGKVAAVIGTPIDAAYPAANKRLQELIASKHLLISQFANGSRVFPSNFPARNRTMAALTDASVIIEASESSGTLHQAAECKRLGRWLAIAQSMIHSGRAEWPNKFLSYEKCHVLISTSGLIEAVYGN